MDRVRSFPRINRGRAIDGPHMDHIGTTAGIHIQSHVVEGAHDVKCIVECPQGKIHAINVAVGDAACHAQPRQTRAGEVP